MGMNPYDIDIDSLKESRTVTDEFEILKYKVLALFLDITDYMEVEDIKAKTGLHKSDISRLRTFRIKRFSIDRLISLIYALGHEVSITSRPKPKSKKSNRRKR